jgi:hypothetical protein
VRRGESIFAMVCAHRCGAGQLMHCTDARVCPSGATPCVLARMLHATAGPSGAHVSSVGHGTEGGQCGDRGAAADLLRGRAFIGRAVIPRRPSGQRVCMAGMAGMAKTATANSKQSELPL